MRGRQFNMRMSDREAERFRAVAAHHGLSVVEMIRMLVKLKSNELGLELLVVDCDELAAEIRRDMPRASLEERVAEGMRRTRGCCNPTTLRDSLAPSRRR